MNDQLVSKLASVALQVARAVRPVEASGLRDSHLCGGVRVRQRLQGATKHMRPAPSWTGAAAAQCRRVVLVLATRAALPFCSCGRISGFLTRAVSLPAACLQANLLPAFMPALDSKVKELFGMTSFALALLLVGEPT